MISVSLPLITGANGLVGKSLCSTFQRVDQDWIGTCFSRNNPNLISLDITNEDQVHKLFKQFSISELYHCVNMKGGVNACEKSRELAYKYHYLTVKRLCDLCKRYDIALIFISTDYIFGNHDFPVDENGQSEPLNYYGQLKLMAEQEIQKQLKKYIIARTTNVYGYDPKTQTPNYFMQVLRSLQNEQVFKAATNSYGSPTCVDDLTQTIFQLTKIKKWGVYHIVGDEYLSRFEWAMKIAQELNLDQTLIEGCIADNSQIKRPIHLRLDNQKIKQTLNFNFKKTNEYHAEIRSKILD